MVHTSPHLSSRGPRQRQSERDETDSPETRNTCVKMSVGDEVEDFSSGLISTTGNFVLCSAAEEI